MNQYPAGLVPMMVPQQYMVMPSAAMQLPHGMSGHHPHGALQPAAMLHHQHMAAQAAAASHAAGAPVITSPVVTSAGALSALSMGHQGMVSIAGLPPHMAGVSAMGGAVPGLHQAISAGIPTPYGALTPLAATSALSSGLLTQQQHQQHLQYPPQHASPQLQQLQHLQQTPPSSQHSGSSQDFRKKDDDRGYGRQSGNRWQAEADLDLEELNLDESLVVLDHFNSDLNLVVDEDGYGGTVLNNPSGFCFTWAGARATYGVCRGKTFFEVHIMEHLPTDFGDDHQETDPHIIRVGWSIDSSSFQLGEEPWSFGYGGTGKFSTNNRFTDYGVRFEEGDVIGAMLDLDSRPASISYMKNGTWYGVAAPLHGFPVGSKEMALFPHILSKNCRFKVNFGQLDAWFPPPMGFRYIGHLQLMERVRGMTPPATKSDCEMVMIVGLPGAGKTTWAINMQKNHPQKRYNIIGTDTLIDKMRVMGLPRKRNYHGRWEVLIDKATKCLNKLFTMAAKRRRNYILDQTNVYGSARRRKMKNFTGFYRIAAVIQPDDPELERRSKKRTQEDGKVVPESAVLEMKANFSLPEDRDSLFDRIDFIELQKDVVNQLVRTYNQEGKSKPRQDNPQNRFDGNKKPDQRQQQYGGYGSQNYGRSSSYDKDSSLGKREHWYPDRDELPSKRGKPDPGSALDLLKQQYEEDDRQVPTQQGSHVARSSWQDSINIKEEPGGSVPSSQWSQNAHLSGALNPGYPQGLIPSHATASQPGLLGAPPALHHGHQLAFLPPGMPPPPPSELAGLGLAGKAMQESSAHNSAQVHSQMAPAHASAGHGQILLDPTKLRTGSPYTYVSQATGQNLYGTAPPSYESLVNQDSSRQSWQQATEHSQTARGHGQSAAVSQQQQMASWQQEQEESLPKSQSKPWEQEKSSTNSWQSDFQGRRDGRDVDKRGGGSRDSSFGRPDSRDSYRERDRDRDRERDRDRNRDRDYGYNRNKNDDRGGYGGNNDRDRDRRDGGYGRDSGSSWGNQGYGSGLSSDRQDPDFGKGDRQRKRKSKWDQPGDEQAISMDQIKQESDVDEFSGGQSQPVQNMYCQPPPSFPGSSRFTSSTNHPPGASRSAGDQDIKPSTFDINFSRPPPPLMGNLKTDFSSSKDSNTPEIKLPPVGNSGDGLLGQGPGPKPLIPGLQGNMSAGQFKAKGSFSGPQPFRQTQGGGNDSSHSRSSDNSASRSNASVNSRSSDNSTNSTMKPFSPDNDNENNKRQSPKPLIKLEEKSPERHSSPSDKGDVGGSSNQSRGGPGKPGLFPTPGSSEADVGPPKSPPFRPRGPPGLMGRFPGPPSNMGPRSPRGGPMGPRGPPPHGPMGGPPRGPMGGPGPHHGPRGPGPWNQNHPRFGPRGPQGPPRPLFDGPPGRWPQR